MERESAAGGGSEVDVEEDERRQSLRVWEEKVLRDRPVPAKILKSQFSSGFLSFKCTRTLTFDIFCQELARALAQAKSDEVRASTAQDIFQLGLLLYEAFSGTPLMDTWENDLASVLEATEGEVPISFRRIKDPVARYIITNCLRRDAGSRFSVADVKNNLKQMWVTNHALTRVQHGIIE